jgi:hypothetical protein
VVGWGCACNRFTESGDDDMVPLSLRWLRAGLRLVHIAAAGVESCEGQDLIKIRKYLRLG